MPRHEVARTSLRSFIGPIWDGDFDISDVDCLFCICGNPRRAKPSGTQDASKFGAVLICFVVATASGLLAAVCGRLTYKCMTAASRT